jgi:hypothetical protein
LSLDDFRRHRESMNAKILAADQVGGSIVIPHVRHGFATLAELRAEEGESRA